MRLIQLDYWKTGNISTTASILDIFGLSEHHFVYTEYLDNFTSCQIFAFMYSGGKKSLFFSWSQVITITRKEKKKGKLSES